MTQSETFQATIDIDASSATEELNRAYAGIERLFRTTNEAGEEIESSFLKGIDTINRLRGNLDDVSDQFKVFGARGAKIAESLEKITDPAKRLTLSQELLKKEMANSTGVFAKLGDKSAELQARFHALSPVSKGALLAVAAGATAAAAATAKLAQVVAGQLVDAWKAWAAQSHEAIQIQEDLDGKTERLQVSLGRLVEESAHITDAQVGFGASSTDLSTRIDSLTSSISGLNEESGNSFNIFGQYTAALVELGRREKERLGLIQATNPLLLTQSALLDQLAASSLQAGTGLEGVEQAMKDASIEAWKLNRALDELDRKWSSIADLDVSAAVGGTQEAGGGAKGVVDKLEEDRKARAKQREDYLKGLDKTLNEFVGSLSQEEKELGIAQVAASLQENSKLRQWGAGLQSQTTKSMEGADENARAKDLAVATKSALGGVDTAASSATGATDQATASLQAMGDAMNGAVAGSISLAAGMAGMALATLAAGDSMATFGWQALQMFGDFASQAGQVMLATGIGQLALFSGNPVGAIVAGSTLIGLGAVLGGLAKRNLKQGGGGGGGAQAASQIIDTFVSRNKREEEEPQPIIVYAQFGTERLEPAIANATMSAERNGRLPRRARR